MMIAFGMLAEAGVGAAQQTFDVTQSEEVDGGVH